MCHVPGAFFFQVIFYLDREVYYIITRGGHLSRFALAHPPSVL